MKLRFITGRSGSGKSEFIANEIISMAKENPDKNIIYVVPEQFSLQAERNLIEKSESKTILNAQVLSFKRLAYHVFSELGQADKPLLNDISKAILLRKILNDKLDEFVYFNKAICKKQGFVEKISKTISELFQYCVTVQKLEELILKLEEEAEGTDILLKLKDILVIYSSYIKYLEEEYISSDETLDLLSEKLIGSRLVKGAIIFIDGFNGFTPQEFKVLDSLFKVVENITVALTLTSSPNYIRQFNTYDPYYDSKTTIRRLKELAKANKAIIEEPIVFKENLRHKENKELAFLEENYFKYPSKEYKLRTENIRVYGATNKYKEIKRVAGTITRLVKAEGYRYSDIAIITPNEDYYSYLISTLDKFEIPYFSDSKKNIKNHSLTELICSALDIIKFNFSYEAVFGYIKTGFLAQCSRYEVTEDMLNRLENYVLAYGIKGYRWKQESWLYGFGEKSKFNAEDINSARNAFLKSIEPLRLENQRQYSVKEIANSLMDFLIQLEVPKSLSKRNELLAENSIERKENIQVWKAITEIINDTVKILGEAKMYVSEYSDILNAAFENTKTGFIPSSQDQIIIGDFVRTCLPRVKALFVLNVNDGALPASKNDLGFIDDAERQLIADKGVEIAPDSKRLLSQDNFLVYTTLTKPSEKLFLSYSTSDLSGKEIKPSLVINNIEKIFPFVSKSFNSLLNKMAYDDINALEPAFEALVSLIKSYKENDDNSELIKELYLYFSDIEEYKKRLDKIEKGLFKLNPTSKLDEKSISRLYSNKMINLSITKLEAFNSCPFSYFLNCGLKVSPRELYDVGAMEIGNLYHSILKNFSELLEMEKINWHNVTAEQVNEYVDNATDKALKSLNSDIFSYNSKYKHYIERIKRSTKMSAYALTESIKMGDFNPYGFEFSLREIRTDENGNPIEEGKRFFKPIEIRLENGYKILLNGCIDRVDIMDKENKVYVNVIDYKSSEKALEMQEIYLGVQLQLIMYLDAFIRLKENDPEFSQKAMHPAGVFYFKIADPIFNLESKKVKAENVVDEKLFSDNFKQNALISNKKEVLQGFDKSVADKSIDKIKAGDFSFIKPTFCSEENLRALMNYVNLVAKESAEKMLDGNIEIYPLKIKNKDACKFCDYENICSLDIIDKKVFGKNSKYNSPKELSSFEYMKKILDKLGIGDEENVDKSEDNEEIDKLNKKGE